MLNKEDQIATVKMIAKLDPAVYAENESGNWTENWCRKKHRDDVHYCTRNKNHDGPHVAIFWDRYLFKYLGLDPWFDEETNV